VGAPYRVVSRPLASLEPIRRMLTVALCWFAGLIIFVLFMWWRAVRLDRLERPSRSLSDEVDRDLQHRK
jgi:hypothetical protein